MMNGKSNLLAFVPIRSAKDRQECLSYFFGAFDVAAFGGVNANAVPFIHKGWNGNGHSIFEQAGLFTLETVAPFMVGSVRVTVNSIEGGRSMPIGAPS